MPDSRSRPGTRSADDPGDAVDAAPHARYLPLSTLIGPGARVLGDLRCDHPVEIRGTLEGDCHTTARCTVHEGGRVLGNIEAIALVVAGEVDAGLLRAEKVEIRDSAHVSGVISAKVVAIADGAYFRGEIDNPEAAEGPARND